MSISNTKKVDDVTPTQAINLLKKLQSIASDDEDLRATLGLFAQVLVSKAIEIIESTQQSQTLHTVLRDPEGKGTLDIIVELNDIGSLEIKPKGYGSCGMENGQGCPLYLDLHEGKLKIVYFDDVNDEDNKSISLEGARESNRKEN